MHTIICSPQLIHSTHHRGSVEEELPYKRGDLFWGGGQFSSIYYFSASEIWPYKWGITVVVEHTYRAYKAHLQSL